MKFTNTSLKFKILKKNSTNQALKNVAYPIPDHPQMKPFAWNLLIVTRKRLVFSQIFFHFRDKPMKRTSLSISKLVESNPASVTSLTNLLPQSYILFLHGILHRMGKKILPPKTVITGRVIFTWARFPVINSVNH